MATEFQVQMSSADDIISVKMFGHAGTQDVLRGYRSVLSFAESYHSTSILVDVRELTLAYEPLQMIAVLEQLSKMFAHYRLARIVVDGNLQHQLVESLAANRQLTIRNFNCEEMAINWLKQPEPVLET